MELKFTVQTKILKPAAEVFDAIVNPTKLSGYFTEKATPMEEGGVAKWKFPEFDETFPVWIKKIVPNQLIVLEWESQEGPYHTKVEIRTEPIDAQTTMLKISESGWRENQKGLESSYGNCGGWMHMSCCLKAYLEYGINLRKGGAL
jgi:uncharacterized protein YndB with AHSA1/START domain